MSPKKIQVNNGILISVLLLLYPILSLPKIINEIYKGRYYSLHYLSFFMGLVAYLFAPTGDTYEYYKDYLKYQTISFSDYIGILQFDIVHETILYFFARCNIYFGFFRFFIAFICYELIFSVYKTVIRETNIGFNNTGRFWVFLFFFFVVGFATFLRGIRFNFALAIFFYGYCCMFYNKRLLRGILFMLITALTHYSLIPIVIPTVLIYYLPFNVKKKTVFLLLVILYVLSSTLLVSVIEMMKLGVELKERLDFYTTGYWAGDVLGDHSLKFRYAQILVRLTFYPLILLYIFKIKSIRDYGLYSFMLLVLIIVADMNTIFNRYSFFSIFAFIVPYLINRDFSYLKRDFYILLIISFISYSASVFSFRRELSVGKVERIFYMPLPGILLTTYDKQWINSHMYDNGDFDF